MSVETNQIVNIKIEIPEGSASGVWVVDGGLNWDGNVVVCPRAFFDEARSMGLFDKPGVYILRGQGQGQIIPTIYIGEGDPVRGRLESHVAKKVFWDEVFVCVSDSGKLNKAHIQHLESRLVTLAKGAQLCDLDNDNNPQLPSLSKPEADAVEKYLNRLLLVLKVLGLKIFEKQSPPDTLNGVHKPHSTKGEKTIPMLVIRGTLKPGDRLHLIRDPGSGLKIPEEKAKRATFMSEQEIRWDFDGQAYSLSGLCKKIWQQFGGSTGAGAFQGPHYWAKEGEDKSLAEMASSLDSMAGLKNEGKEK